MNDEIIKYVIILYNNLYVDPFFKRPEIKTMMHNSVAPLHDPL